MTVKIEGQEIVSFFVNLLEKYNYPNIVSTHPRTRKKPEELQASHAELNQSISPNLPLSQSQELPLTLSHSSAYPIFETFGFS